MKLADLVAIGGGEKPEVRHLFDYAPSGTYDEDWIPSLAPGGWTVVTADGGRTPNKKRGEKLPQLCAQHSLTHILLSSYVHHRVTFEKLLIIMSVWYQLIEIASDETQTGNRYLLEPQLPVRGRGKLTERPIVGRPAL